MKLIIFLLLIANTATAQLQVLGGVSYSPKLEVNKINKYSLLPFFCAAIGDNRTALNVQIGNVSKLGLICRKGVFRAGMNFGLDLFYKERVQVIAELELGVLFQLPNTKDTFLSITSIFGCELDNFNSSYSPLNISIFKSLIQSK